MLSTSLSFDKQQRIKLKKDFGKLLAQGKRIKNNFFRLIFLPNPQSLSRIAIWVRKKDYKTAVQRNKLKRWVREDFRKWQHEFKQPVSIIVRINYSDHINHRKEFTEQLIELFKRIDR